MSKVKPESILLAQYFCDWMQEGTTTSSVHTIKNYRDTIALYLTFLEERNVKRNTLSGKFFSREYIVKWIEWIRTKRKCTAQTCNNRLSTLRVYLKYISGRNPQYLYLWLEACTIKRQVIIKQEFEYISKEAIEAVLSIPKPNDKTDYRYLVLMSFLYSTAARIDEALSIKVKDLKLGGPHSYVTVIGKGRKARTLNLAPKIVSHLKLYLKRYHGKDIKEEAYVWFSKIKGPLFKASQEGINKKIKEYAAKAHEKCTDVPLHLHAHSFRHARATHLLENGMNVVQLSRYLGHENIDTTNVYLNISPTIKANAMEKMEEPQASSQECKWKDDQMNLTALFGISK